MSNSHNYYYVISSLPELKFDSKLPFSLKEFISEYSDELKADKKFIDILLLKNDIENLKLFFKKTLNEKSIKIPSVYSFEEIKEKVSIKEEFPDFINEFLNKYDTNEKYLENFDDLRKEYLLYGLDQDNDFLKEYFQFELNLRNVIASIRSRTKKVDVIKYNVGDTDDVIMTSIKSNKTVPDFGIGNEAPWIGKLIQAIEKSDPLEIEKAIDIIRLEQIDEITNLLTFQTEKVLAFIVKLMIIERWDNFDSKEGGRYTHSIVNEIL